MMNTNPHFPANILRDEVLRIFESMLEKYDIQEAFNKGLSAKLILISTDAPLNDFAEVKVRFDEESNDKILNITVYDNFCQYLWSLSYSTILFFKESTIKGLTEIPKSDEDRVKAIHNFEKALNLRNNPPTSRSDFFNEPNPVNHSDQEFVKIANNIFKIALAFILLHEFAHISLGHIEKITDEKSDEECADYEALFKLITKDGINEELVAFGCITSIASLVFLDKHLSGGDSHPDPDLRLKKLLHDLEAYLSELNCELSYSFAAIWLQLWAIYYKKYDLIDNVDLGSDYKEKEYFLAIISELDIYKRTINTVER